MYSKIITHVEKYVTPTSHALKAFTSLLQPLELKKKENLIHPGTYIQHEFFVESGCLIAYYLDKKGHKHIIQFAIEDWWVGDFDAFYNKIPSKLYIEAIENAKLWSISFNDLEQLYHDHPIFERYFRILVTRGFISQRKRVLSTLQENAKERYLDFCKTYPNIESRVPNYHIANYLGLSPESLSRIRKTLTEEGLNIDVGQP
ncbi:Crp/Fnr family transcriptional regulator [Croceivirga radicis]|uniref:Crp/Fnr family transcriptional regulator n=1 Tax=Croceivirga radicis TaxID=1929488 RepID=UPI000255AE0F|nr:Crp/Fnr family transcriptional regulator [Croceivirga radicis]